MALVIPLLAACAGDSSRYPSLAIRDAERFDASEASSQPVALSPLSEENTQRVEALVNSARDSHQQFISERAGAAQLARSARGQSTESDSLARAMVAAAKLSSLRGQTSVALSGLDTLYAEAASNFVETSMIEAAQADVGQMIAEQTADLAAIEQAMR